MAPYIIDSHEDIAYNALSFGRDYLLSAAETRGIEKDTSTPQRNGQTLLGWPDYQRGQVAVVFATLFLAPRRYQSGAWETQVFGDAGEARRRLENQLNFYRRLCDDHPEQFRLIYNKKDLQQVLEPWKKEPAFLLDPVPAAAESETRKTVTHPVGLVLSLEGLEGLRAPEELEEWLQMGVHFAGPVWAGTRFCGGTYEPGEFTREGYALLEVMASLGFTLDISHMTEASALQALDRYEGPVIASHANARALLKGGQGERQLTDLTIRRLIERDGVMGVVPYNRFLRPGWANADDRQLVTLRTLVAHIDHICQLAGDALHAGLGTDFDGGFGWPAIPYEIDTIADLQKLAPLLAEYGYPDESIANILSENWRRQLERTLPEK
jgi:membrane dipeptidase